MKKDTISFFTTGGLPLTSSTPSRDSQLSRSLPWNCCRCPTVETLDRRVEDAFGIFSIRVWRISYPHGQNRGSFASGVVQSDLAWDRAPNWCYLVIFWSPLDANSSQTDGLSKRSQNNSAGFSWISVKNYARTLWNHKSRITATVGKSWSYR